MSGWHKNGQLINSGVTEAEQEKVRTGESARDRGGNGASSER